MGKRNLLDRDCFAVSRIERRVFSSPFLIEKRGSIAISVKFPDIAIQGIFMVILTMGLVILLKYKGGVTKFSAGVFIFIYFLFLYFNFQYGLGIKL